MPMLLLPLDNALKPQKRNENSHRIRKTKKGKKKIGSFEKAVPVIFKPRGVKRPLFPWLLTGLIPFRGASERADAESIATQVPNAAAHEALKLNGFACSRPIELLNTWRGETTAGAGAPIVKPPMQPLSTRVPAVQGFSFCPHRRGRGGEFFSNPQNAC